MEYAALKPVILERVGDAQGARFSDALLRQAVRQALDAYSAALPRWLACECIAVLDGAEQPLTEVTSFLTIVGVEFPPGFDRPDFCVRMDDGVRLSFYGRPFPQTGDTLRVVYTAVHTLAGLDEALGTTVNPAHMDLLADGAAALALLLRAAALAETPNRRPEDAQHLLARGRADHLRYLGLLTQLGRAFSPALPLPAAGWGSDEPVFSAAGLG